jgi:poly-gamma-glutamate synthesis protein (capsule biosynthesis protein)
MPKIVKLAFLGDLMLGRGVSQKLRNHPPEWFWGNALPILRQADAAIANLEAPITAHDERWRRTWKLFHFKADPAAVRILTAANIRFVCLANNHMLDYGESGLRDTVEALDRVGILHAGAGRTMAAAAAPQVLELPGLKVGLIAATDNMREFAATADGPGTNYRVFRPEPPNLDWIERSVSDLRRQDVALIVLSVHWGPNMRITPSQDFRRFAHAALERGVDVIHGHSAHVVQAIERHGRGVILYDTGNFIDDYWKFPFRRTIWSFVFNLIIEDGRPTRVQLVPILIHSSPLGLARGDVFQAITSNMKSLCAPFGTPLIDTPDGLEIALGERAT